MVRPKAFDPDSVLDHAMKTFWSKGFMATTVQDLVESTGLGRGSLYNAFTSKDTTAYFMSGLGRHADTMLEMVADIVKGIPLSRMGEVDDLTGMCLFLLSDQAKWVTGQIFNVDGGQIIRS